MVRCRMRSPSERPLQANSPESGEGQEQERGLSPEHTEAYRRTYRGRHYRRRCCSWRRLCWIHRRQRPSCRRRRRCTCRRRCRQGCRRRRRRCRRYH
ncbi:protamine-2 [Heterocephalus glaber]|uniref:Protamine-2 n=1 Tax=Heterocephalus glaber TaxID=10181 RepID=A0AAX6RVJ3_HETGA|nr:protamine-2 [Heterocephalus glaber]